jgi:uncharacterized protein YjlB
LHVHDREETLEVLEGRVVLHAGGESRSLAAGESTVAPAGVPHALRVASPVARYVVTARAEAPGRYEDFLEAVAHPAALDEAEAAALAVLGEPNGIAVLGPPGALPPGAGR